MLPLKRILHPTDFSEGAQAALGRAAMLARHYGAALHVLHVTPTFGDDPVRGAFEAAADERAFYRHLREEANDRMRDCIEQAGEGLAMEDVRVMCVHTHGPSPAEAIVEYATAEAIDLVVMGSHGRRGVRRFVMGSVAEAVVRRAPCDVLTVRAGTAPLALRRLLVPVDLSSRAEVLIRQAASLGAATSAHLDVLHVVEPPAPSVEAFSGYAAKAKRYAQEHVEQLLRKIDRPLLSMQLHVREGHPASVIAKHAADEAIDLVVMASHGRSGLERFLLGSVTEQVLRIAPCSVWTVRTAEPPFEALPVFRGEADSAADGAAG